MQFEFLKDARAFNRVVFAANEHPISIRAFEKLMTSCMTDIHFGVVCHLKEHYDVTVRYVTLRVRNKSEKMNCFRGAVMLGLSDPEDDYAALDKGEKPHIYELKLMMSGSIQIMNLSPDEREYDRQIDLVRSLLHRLNRKIEFTLGISFKSVEQKNIGLTVTVPREKLERWWTQCGRLRVEDLMTDYANRTTRQFPENHVTTWATPEKETVSQYCRILGPQNSWKVHLTMYCSGKVLLFGRDLYRVRQAALHLESTLLALAAAE